MRHSIQVQLPLLLLLIGIVAIGSLYRYLIEHQTEANRVEASRDLKAAGTQLAGMAEYLLQQENDKALHMGVFLAGQFPDLTLAVVADGQDQILHATQPSWNDRALADSPLAVANTLFPQARATMSGRWGEFDDGRLLVGVYAFKMPIKQTDLSTEGTGIVVMGVNQATSILTAQREAQRIAIVAGSALLLLVLFLWFMLYRLLTRPVQALVKTTRAFSEGDYRASANITVNNEMGELSTALDTMADTAMEREQAQAKSRRLAQIVEDSVNEIYVSDADSFQIIDVNNIARENLGYSEEESLELFPWDFVHGMTQENIGQMIEPLLNGSINVASFETVHKRKDGSNYPVLTRLQYMSHQTPPVYCAMVQDITELQEQQAALKLRDRAIAEVDVGVLITDARRGDNPIVYANAAITEMTGFSADEFIGRNPRFLQNNDRDQPALDSIRNALIEQVPVQALLRNYAKDGNQFMTEVSISPVRDAEGTVTHFIGIQRDVTERLATEAQLLQGQKIDAIGQLSGGIAHDFNNLLSVITGNLEFLRMDLNDPALHEYIDEAESAANMGARLTRRLLAFARQGALEPAIVNINDQILDALELLQSTIGETITLSSNLSQELWTTRADPSEVENTVVNLAINARDAMPKGGRIQIETTNEQLEKGSHPDIPSLTAGGYVRLTISDNGCGMPDEIKARIFEPFYTTKSEGKGTGLGLASIYGFAKQSGGHITVESEVDVGTTFNLYLPRCEESNTSTSDKETTPPDTQTNQSKILVVEDNEMVRKVTVRRLQALGFETLTASDGPSALSLLDAESSIDLVLSDVVMDGGMSGYDVAQWVQNNRPDCGLLLTSGFNERLADENDIDFSSLYLLPKPYNLQELKQAVDKVLTGASAND